MELPIGLEADLKGIVDLVRMKAVYFDGDNGENLRYEEIPAELAAEAARRREQLLDAVSMFSDDLMEAVLEERATEEMIHAAIRTGHPPARVDPGVPRVRVQEQGRAAPPRRRAPLSPLPHGGGERGAGHGARRGSTCRSISDPAKPTVALAFKLEDGRYGQLTYVRVYQGAIHKGDSLVNARTGKRFKVGRLVRMHADEMEEIEASNSGDIVAMFGIDCASGDTFYSAGHPLQHDLHVRARAGDQPGHRAQGQQGADQHEQGAQPLHQGGSHLPHLRGPGEPARPSSRAWGSCTWTCTSSA